MVGFFSYFFSLTRTVTLHTTFIWVFIFFFAFLVVKGCLLYAIHHTFNVRSMRLADHPTAEYYTPRQFILFIATAIPLHQQSEERTAR